MSSCKTRPFRLDSHASPRYRSGQVLEEVLHELDSAEYNRKVDRFLFRFNRRFRDLDCLESPKYWGDLLMGQYYGELDRLNLPLLVTTLLKNLIQTKYKDYLRVRDEEHWC